VVAPWANVELGGLLVLGANRTVWNATTGVFMTRKLTTVLTAVSTMAAVTLAGSLPASATCGSVPYGQTRWYEHSYCGGQLHSAYGNDFVANVSPYGFNDEASSINLDAAVQKVRYWWDNDCSGNSAAVHGGGVDTYFNTITYNDKMTSYKTFTSVGDGYPSSPAACVSAS